MWIATRGASGTQHTFDQILCTVFDKLQLIHGNFYCKSYSGVLLIDASPYSEVFRGVQQVQVFRPSGSGCSGYSGGVPVDAFPMTV